MTIADTVQSDAKPESPKLACPKCHSTSLTKFGKEWRTRDGKRVRIQRYICRKGHITCNPVTGPPRDSTGRFSKRLSE